jgi:hypothetical protein
VAVEPINRLGDTGKNDFMGYKLVDFVDVEAVENHFFESLKEDRKAVRP